MLPRSFLINCEQTNHINIHEPVKGFIWVYLVFTEIPSIKAGYGWPAPYLHTSSLHPQAHKL